MAAEPRPDAAHTSSVNPSLGGNVVICEDSTVGAVALAGLTSQCVGHQESSSNLIWRVRLPGGGSLSMTWGWGSGRQKDGSPFHAEVSQRGHSGDNCPILIAKPKATTCSACVAAECTVAASAAGSTLTPLPHYTCVMFEKMAQHIRAPAVCH